MIGRYVVDRWNVQWIDKCVMDRLSACDWHTESVMEQMIVWWTDWMCDIRTECVMDRFFCVMDRPNVWWADRMCNGQNFCVMGRLNVWWADTVDRCMIWVRANRHYMPFPRCHSYTSHARTRLQTATLYDPVAQYCPSWFWPLGHCQALLQTATLDAGGRMNVWVAPTGRRWLSTLSGIGTIRI